MHPPAAQTQYLTPNKNKKQLGFEDDLAGQNINRYATTYGNIGEEQKATLGKTFTNMHPTSAGDQYGATKTTLLPDITASQNSNQKKRYNKTGSKSVEQSMNMPTIPLHETLGNDSAANALTNDRSMRESMEVATGFDTKKWKKIINGNVEMIQKKVDQSTPHHVLYRELDDLKMIVGNCFDQLSKSLARQIEISV